MDDNLTPPRQSSNKAMTMDFYTALKELYKGKQITRISWGNDDYCLMQDGCLSIFREGKFHKWLVIDGDFEGNDWIVTEPVEVLKEIN